MDVPPVLSKTKESALTTVTDTAPRPFYRVETLVRHVKKVHAGASGYMMLCGIAISF
jgi:hypothetical protein